jgi:hypothetical protein
MLERMDESTEWKALPPLPGGVFVSMVTEVLDKENIPNMVKTDLESGGLGVIMGTESLGDPWRIYVAIADYDRAMQVFDSLMGDEGEAETGSEPPA